MTQKNNISAAVIIICAALTLSACITKKRDKDTTGVTAASCKDQRKAFDNYRKVCVTPPDLNFCATNFSMVKGINACRAPASLTECRSLGTALQKTMHWSGGTCQLLGGTTGIGGNRDSNIKIDHNFKSYMPSASQYVMIGSATITINHNKDVHQINILKENGATCDLRHSSVGGKTFTVEAKGPVSTCKGKILVINTKTGNYNVEEFRVTIR